MSHINEFKLERYFAKYEFTAPFLLSASDCESLSLKELLALGDAKSLAAWDQLNLGYTESNGHPGLREEISQFYPPLSPDHILITSPEEGIFIAMNVLLSPGDEVIVMTPAYQSLYEIARSIGCTIVEWPLTPSGVEWQLDVAALPRLVSSRTKMMVINFPNNPTGYLPDHKNLNEIVEIARNSHLWLFSDEMYRFLEYEAESRLPAICTLYQRGISLSGMSKVYGLAGLRIGWLALQDEDLYRKLLEFKDYTTICSSAPSEILAYMSLRAKNTLINRSLNIIRENLGLIRYFMDKNKDLFKWYQPSGGSVAFPRWLGPKSISQVCRELVDSYGVMAVPGDIFNFEGPHLRVGLGRRNLGQALERTQGYLDRMS